MARNPLPGRLLLDVFRALPSDGGLTVAQIVKYYSTTYEVPMQRAVIVVHRAIKSAMRAGFMYRANRRLKLGLQEKKRSRGRIKPKVEGEKLYGTENYFITELLETDAAAKKDDEKGGNAPKDGPSVGGGGGSEGIFPPGRGGTSIPGEPSNHAPSCPHGKHNSGNKTEENEEDDEEKNTDTSTYKSDPDTEDTTSNGKKRRTKRSASEQDESASRRKARRRRVMQPCCQHSPRRVRRRTRR